MTALWTGWGALARLSLRPLLAVVIVIVGLLVPTMADARQPSPEPAPDGEVIGGHLADPGEYPFQVALLLHDVRDRRDAAICGGTLISPDTVLTAGHCVFFRGRAWTPADIDILAGTNRLQGGGGRRVRARQIRVHPGYDETDDFALVNDIAIIQLGVELPYSTVTPAVAGQEALYPPGTMATTTGWGDRNILPSQQDLPRLLREVEVPVVSDADCLAAYPDRRFPDWMVAEQSVCAGDLVDGGEDSCNGDSGGPLLVPDGDDWLQIGIVSTGQGCALPRYPGIYTEVSSFPFITRFLDPDETPDPVTRLRGGRAFGAVFLDWQAPFFDGGTRIIRYRVDLPDLGRAQSVSGARTDAVLRDLPPGRHRVEVRAVNALGRSQARAIFVNA